MRARPVGRKVAAAVVELAVTGAVFLASCAADGASSDAARGSPEPTGSTSESSAPAASVPPTPTAASTLPASCPALLPDAEVVRALGKPLGGQTTYVLQAPLPEIGRLGRVTCGYGVNVTATGARSTPILQASVLLYVDAASANERVQATVAESRAKGDAVTPTQVGGRPGFVLENPELVTVVGNDGTRTVVVGLEANVLPADQARQALVTMANLILSGPQS